MEDPVPPTNKGKTRDGSSDHGSGHGHSHAHAHDLPVERDLTLAFGVGVGLNIAFAIAECVFGALAHSVALVADAAHNFGDVLGLLLAWGAMVLAKRKPSRRRTYGLRRTTILAALANSLLLVVAVGGVSWEAIKRLRDPGPVEGTTMIVVAAIGVVINASSAFFFMKGRHGDANVRGAFLHLAGDAAVSLGVVASGVVIRLTGWRWVDPGASLLVSIVILATTWSLLRDAMNLALDAVPSHIDPEAVRSYLASLPDVREVHDLHIWAMSTTEVALTAHLVMPHGAQAPKFLREVCKILHDEFRIDHPTLQIDPSEGGDVCRLANNHA